MGIEIKNAKQDYAVTLHAVAIDHREPNGRIGVHHSYLRLYLAADSEDEAFGRATKIADKRFPSSEDWCYKHILLLRIDNIDWIDRCQDINVDPAKRPW